MVKVVLTTEVERLATLRQYHILDTEPEPIFDNLVQIAASICETPAAAITAIDANRLWFKAITGWQIREIPLKAGFCPLCLESYDLTIVPDTLLDERTKNLPLVTSMPYIRFYVGAPLVGTNGAILGTLCVFDEQPRKLSDRQLTSLKILADQTIKTLELRRQIISQNLPNRQDKLSKPENPEKEPIYRSILDAMPQGAIFLSTHGVICNSQAENILGRWGKEAQAHLLLEPCWQAISENGTPFTIDNHPAWVSLRSGESIPPTAIGIPKPDNSLSWVKIAAHPLLLNDGVNGKKAGATSHLPSNGVLCSLTEIIAPDPLQICDRELLSLSSDLWGIFSRDGYLKELLNASWQTTLGYDSAELLAQPWIEFVPVEDRQIMQEQLKGITGVKTVKHLASRWRCRDGSLKWICWSGVPIPDSDLIYAIGRNITESRLLEASLRELDNVNLALDRAAIVAIVDLNCNIKHVNQKLCQLSLFAPEELIGKPFNFFDFGDRGEQFFNELWGSLNNCQIWKGEIKCKSKDGGYFWADMTIVPLSDRQGQPTHYFVIGNDITDKKQLEKQFLHAQRLESIGTMAGGISHDLNNILTPILAASQLLQLKFPEADSRTKELLKTLEINSKRGASLVRQVLSFARGLEGTKTVLNLKHIITEIQQIITPTFPKNIEIIAEMSPNLGMVLGDPTQLHQVLMNLAVNARDATIDGGTLTIYAENVYLDADYTRLNIEAKVGSYVLIGIMDTGVGVPPEIIDRIFDPFFTTKDIGQGTGLGLATVLTIIKSHNGFIKVDSKVGKGSLFRIYLPAIPNLENLVAIEPELPIGKGELILVVDDETMIVETTKTTLETYNYRVLIASDGIDAIALYAQRKHDISAVIVDLMMPMMDGAQTIRILRRLNPSVKIIAISGLEGNAQQYNLNSLEVFLPKPYTSRDLLERVAQILH
jgi:two-component system, cell cycle sensor histidine kinase and response regulator CckA